nr:MAG TPA_asm: hypothetical protein [Caudoviricetes sp.]
MSKVLRGMPSEVITSRSSSNISNMKTYFIVFFRLISNLSRITL